MDPIMIALIALGLALVVVIIVLLSRTASFPIELEVEEQLDLDEVDGQAVAERIGLAVQLRTISNHDPEKINPLPFEGLRNLLSTLYPEVERRLKREVINGHALLYTWEGSDPKLDAVAFTAHQDVVPADETSTSGWSYPPFAGQLAEGYVWGRGTQDCKGVLITLMEAVERLLREGFTPERTIYLAFGYDEEVSGVHGAHEIARTLRERGTRLAFLLDEGGAVITGSVPGVDVPVGLIGVSEKGHMTLKLRAHAAGGHASAPGEITAIGALSLAIATLESNPFPQDLEMAEFMMSFLGSELPFSQRLALANPWLLGGTVKRRFAQNPASNAITRTTVAPTVIHAGSAENVLPAEAEALVNIRIIPGETIQDVYQRVSDLVADETIEVLPAHGDTLLSDNDAWNPSPVSRVDSQPFELLTGLILATFPGARVAPFMLNGATDARYYTDICENVYRFSPFFYTTEDVDRVHAANERLSFANAGRAVAFYQELMARVSRMSYTELEEDAPQPDEAEDQSMRATGRPERKPKGNKREAKRKIEDQADLLPEENEELVVKPLKEE